MKTTLSKEVETALNSILTSTRAPSFNINICSEAEVEQFFRLQREGICRYFLKNECKKGDACEFRHSQDQIKMKYKTKLCKNYSDNGYCKYKDQCSYAHGEKQLKSGDNYNKFPRSSDDQN